MSQIQSLRVFLNERLAVAAEEIFGAVEKTIAEYQEDVFRCKQESDRLRRLLDIVLKPEIKQHRAEHQQFTVPEEEVLPEQQQEWSLSLDHDEGQQPPQMREEHDELMTRQEGEHLQESKPDTIEFPFTPCCVNSDHNQDPSQSHLYQIQNGEDPERESLPSISTEQIKIEPDGEEYRVLEPSDESLAPSAVNLECPVTQTQSHVVPCCKACGKSFISISSLINHVQMHTNDSENPCGVCGKRFETTQSMSDHLETHVGAKFCHICGKSFARNYQMKVHMRTHTGEKPYRCHFCGKGFTQSGSLKAHTRIHTGEKPYQCRICGKRFITGSETKVHMRTHTGEKPHHCHVCGKAFVQRRNLQAHMKIHMGERLSCCRCHVCGREFTENQELMMHMKIHKGDTA